MTRNTTILFLTSVLLLSGCTTLNKQETAVKPADQEKKKQVVKKKPPVRLDLPDVNLDSDLLFTLLSGEMAGYRGELGIATAQYLSAAKETRDPRVIQRAVRVASYAKLHKQGLEAAQLWVEIEPKNKAAQLNLATLQLRNGLKTEALSGYDALIKSAPDKHAFFITLGKQLIREKNTEQVLEMMSQLVPRFPTVASAHFVLSSLAEKNGKFVLAESAIRQAMVLRKNWTDAQNQLARILRLQGNTEAAINYLKGILDKTPKNKVIRLSYARLLVDAKQMDKAREQFEILAEDEPENSGILYALGILALQSDDLKSAEKYFKQVSSTGRRGLEANYYLGQIAESNGNFTQAMNYYKLVSRGEFAFDAQLRIARLLGKQGKSSEALSLFDDLPVRGDAQLIKVVLARGDILRGLKRFAEAIKGYDEALIRLPDNSDLLYARALMAERVGRLDILMADLKTILKTEPDNAHALNALGYTLADKTGNYKEALSYIKRALKLMPDDAAIIDSMGWIQYRLGNNDEALKHLTRAYDLNDDAEIAAHLGEVLLKMGEKDRGQKVIRKGLEQAPNDERLLEVIKRFNL